MLVLINLIKIQLVASSYFTGNTEWRCSTRVPDSIKPEIPMPTAMQVRSTLIRWVQRTSYSDEPFVLEESHIELTLSFVAQSQGRTLTEQ